MAQSTLAYQKEIMRLRSIIQATAPDRLKTPPAGGGGAYGGNKAGSAGGGRESRSGGGDPRRGFVPFIHPSINTFVPSIHSFLPSIRLFLYSLDLTQEGGLFGMYKSCIRFSQLVVREIETDELRRI